MAIKLRYQIDLTKPLPDPTSAGDFAVRSVAAGDLPRLARLMLDAYLDTIDYEGEDLDDAIDEVRAFLDNENSLVARSYVIEDGDEVVSAVLVSMSEGRPFIDYVMTLPSHNTQGLARHVVAHAIDRLSDDGHDRIDLCITNGNTPSEKLFRSLGAVRVGN